MEASLLSTCAALHPSLFPPSLRMKSAMAPAAALPCSRPVGSLSFPLLRPSLQHHGRSLYSLCRAQASSKITFHFDSTSIAVPFSNDAAVGLSKALESAVNTFREKEKAARPRRWESMEFRHTDDGVFVEFFCNPNAYANFFQAKALVTIDDGKMKIVTEAPLSAVKSEVEQYVKAKV